MSSSEIIEVYDLLHQQSTMIEQQRTVIYKLLSLLGEEINLEEVMKVT